MSKLMNVRCDNCGAEYRLSSRGELNCRFCGSKIYLTDQDFEDYLRTRDEMLNKDRLINDMVNSDGDILGMFNNGQSYNFDFGTNVITRNISVVYNKPDREIFVGLDTVAIIFKEYNAYRNYIANISIITYPSADIKELRQFLPHIYYDGKLADGSYCIILDKDENVYPLEFFITGLKAKTTAWMVSRLENFACLFEFNELDMGNLAIEDIFINPKTHKVYLYGNFDRLVKSPSSNQFMIDFRAIINEITNKGDAPQMYLDFLNNEPANSAFDDFEKWDHVIMNGFNGHNFNKFDYLP